MATTPDVYAANLSFSSRSEDKTFSSAFYSYNEAFTWASDKIKEMVAKGFKMEVFQVVRH